MGWKSWRRFQIERKEVVAFGPSSILAVRLVKTFERNIVLVDSQRQSQYQGLLPIQCFSGVMKPSCQSNLWKEIPTNKTDFKNWHFGLSQWVDIDWLMLSTTIMSSVHCSPLMLPWSLHHHSFEFQFSDLQTADVTLICSNASRTDDDIVWSIESIDRTDPSNPAMEKCLGPTPPLSSLGY